MSERAPHSFALGDRVRHERLGAGTVILDQGPTAVVRFEDGIVSCEKLALEPLSSLAARVDRREWDVPLEVINRLQAEAIRSVNDAWGVFSPARMDLLPHQLWVCRQVNAGWPARWLVADDVGLGKTIEAGMILMPLLARNIVRRVLILCPASLVEQWQDRMRTMFDIRLTQYTTEADTPRTDFWDSNDHVVASLQTMRLDGRGRQQRLLESEPWDLVVVDEAHHLNADEKSGQTLGYRLIAQMTEANRIQSMVFFTGTPHRGKDFGFVSLLQLLRPDLFDSRQGLEEQLSRLPEAMIRNNKANVTDLRGNRLFKSPDVASETYSYSPAEERFYRMLTEFIASGLAYASSLTSAEGRAVMLVLVAMQKIASSSVAAIRRALRRRLDRIQENRQRLEGLQQRARLYLDYEELERLGEGDEVAALDEEIAETASELRLREDEEPALRELLAAAEAVTNETRIEKILAVVKGRFAGRSILFFTEYKATQSLLLSALMGEFGEQSVAFINGDERAADVALPDGSVRNLSHTREAAAERFNSGAVRFLVSTEAGGEGIDLQQNCYTLIHADLPWNPMRLHQRVGRLNRYGQERQVEVLSLRNPDTVESRVWDLLNEKLLRVSHALGQVMDEPEDLLQLVLGMASPALYRDLFSRATTVPQESLGEWFDRETASFGGQDAVQVVQELVGNASKFDFQQVSSRLPQVDLPDLRPFFDFALALNNRRVKDDGETISFRTPDAWKGPRSIYDDYQGMTFNRRDRSPDAMRRLLGVGHRLVDTALAQALSRDALVTVLPGDVLHEPLLVFRIRDSLTDKATAPRALVAAIRLNIRTGEGSLLLDWQLLQSLNAIPSRRAVLSAAPSPVCDAARVNAAAAQAEAILKQRLNELDHRFRYPISEMIAVLWPDAGA